MSEYLLIVMIAGRISMFVAHKGKDHKGARFAFVAASAVADVPAHLVLLRPMHLSLIRMLLRTLRRCNIYITPIPYISSLL